MSANGGAPTNQCSTTMDAVILQQTMVYQAAMQEEKLRKGPWHEEEDELLVTFVTLFGERRWDYIAKASGLKRSGKSCRLRWLNYLRPNIKHGWSRIARSLPGRTDNEIKNCWRTRIRKKIQAQEQGALLFASGFLMIAV